MGGVEAVLPSLLVVLSGVAGAFSAYLARKSRDREENRREILETAVATRSNEVVDAVLVEELPAVDGGLRRTIIARPLSAAAGTLLSKNDVEQEVERRVAVLKDRIARIEARFPDDAVIDKVASVNDAIFATSLEALAESVRRIEEKMLSKWDVAKIVFIIIGALGALLGVALAILRFVAQQSVAV